MPGCWSMAINNAAVVFEPDAFIGLDAVSCFNNNIFSNARIQKFLNYARHDQMIGEKRACHYPNTLFFDLTDETETFMSEFCRVSGPLPFWKNTFFTALACLYQLGFKRVYLIGCTFDLSGEAYAHDQKISDVSRKMNEKLYRDTVEKIKTLYPMLMDEGMELLTCHRSTPLEGAVPFISFEDSISMVTTESNSIEFNFYRHALEESK